MNAKRTAAIVNIVFEKILKAASRYSESSSRFMVSNEKVEKVVNPPQKPIVKKSFVSRLIILFVSK